MTGLEILAQVLGWVSFSAWSISFYPQVILNWKRKSVVGLSFEFMVYNWTGFCFYSIYSICKYISQHRYNLTVSVDPNDIAFGVHAFVLVSVTVYQCCIYERQGQVVHWLHAYICATFWVIFVYNAILAGAGILDWWATSSSGTSASYNFVEYLGYVKLIISFIKYAPQAYLNYTRQSTVGWSIENIWLDLTGGVCSFCQQFLDAHNKNDWSVFTSNIPKLLLALESVAFDILFLIQHYLFYRDSWKETETEANQVEPAKPVYQPYSTVNDQNQKKRVGDPYYLMPDSESQDHRRY
eukprot:TRINITY_DN1342_c0_g1_i1.p1 TRINITY_DN1342_c0_g1~~TRINITY_DN1342_c0_g1_i1.p1  ORF type:complete len:319 (-),score=61.21 TRINITY_DN1342_c0_g1_i1:101-988(-)